MSSWLKRQRILKQRAIFTIRSSLVWGGYCADSIVADIQSLALYHGIHVRQFGLYRMLAHRFPIGIYYREAENETQVCAVLDLRRDPSWIRAEMERRNL